MNNFNNIIGGKQKEIGNIQWFGNWTLDDKHYNVIKDDLNIILKIKGRFNGYYIINNDNNIKNSDITGIWSIILNKTEFEQKIGEKYDDVLQKLSQNGTYTRTDNDNYLKKTVNGELFNVSFCVDEECEERYQYRYITEKKWNSIDSEGYYYEGIISYDSYQPYFNNSVQLYLNAIISKKCNAYNELLNIKNYLNGSDNNDNFSPHISFLYIDFYKTNSKIVGKLNVTNESGEDHFNRLILFIKKQYNIHFKDIVFNSYNANKDNYCKFGNFIVKKYNNNNNSSYKLFITTIAYYIINSIEKLNLDEYDLKVIEKKVNNNKFHYYIGVKKEDGTIKELFAIRDHTYKNFIPHISILNETDNIDKKYNIDTKLNKLIHDNTDFPKSDLNMAKNKNTSGCIDQLEITFNQKNKKIDL